MTIKISPVYIATEAVAVTQRSIENLSTPPNSEIICGRNVGTKMVRGMILFFEKKAMLKI